MKVLIIKLFGVIIFSRSAHDLSASDLLNLNLLVEANNYNENGKTSANPSLNCSPQNNDEEDGKVSDDEDQQEAGNYIILPSVKV